MDIKTTNIWFSRLPMEKKCYLFNYKYEDFDSFNGYEECANILYNRWITLGNIVKEELYAYFNR